MIWTMTKKGKKESEKSQKERSTVLTWRVVWDIGYK